MCGDKFRVAHNVYQFVAQELYGLFTPCGTHFGSFGVDEYGYVARHLTHVVDDASHSLRPLMRGVEAYNVHAFLIERAQQADVAAVVGNCGYNFGFLIHYGLCWIFKFVFS